MSPVTTFAARTAQEGFLSPTGVEIAFLLVGVVTLGAAVITVTTKQLVHAALWLVVALGGIAVEYLLLTAEFIAWVQVLIYLGSVVVLLLFGLMLTRAPIGRSPDADSGNRWVALAVAVAAAVTLVWVVVDAFRTTRLALDGTVHGSTGTIGASLFQHWVLPFEALSVLLLAALVGAIVLSRRKGIPEEPAAPAVPRPHAPRPLTRGTAPRARAATHPAPTAGATGSAPVTEPASATEPTPATPPAQEPTTPTTRRTAPAGEAEASATEPTAPATRPIAPATEPTASATLPTAPATEPTAPAEGATAPATEPTAPAADPSVAPGAPGTPRTETD